MTDLNSSRLHHAPNPWALTPLVVFLLSYLVVSIIAGDFYKMPITVAFVIASVVAIAMSKGGNLYSQINKTNVIWNSKNNPSLDQNILDLIE